MPHILYLVHDLADPAVRRRVCMLLAGGATVDVAGFRRGGAPVTEVAGVSAVDLGVTRDADFAQRVFKVAASAVSIGRQLAGLRQPDVVMARNLEMLALASRLVGGGRPARLVYESLDIHRLLLRQDPIGATIRAVERRLMRRASLLVTSSPAFVREYFAAVQNVRTPVLLIENKVVETGPGPAPAAPLSGDHPGRPWRIGWFGALRCAKSLALLDAFTRASNGAFEVVLRGRPAYTEFDDFDGAIASAPHVTYRGPYRAEDLPAIYGEVEFVWAIDFFEEGLNSSWLLPNRLYEGGRHRRIPVALAGTETARTLEALGIGIVLPEATVEALSSHLGTLDAPAIGRLAAAVASLAPSTFVADRADCSALVRSLAGAGGGTGATHPTVSAEAS